MTDEDRLVELLQRHQAGDSHVEGDILELVDTYFRRSLRPVVARVFGTSVVGNSGNDGRCRYTEMVNDFFVKVLDKRPDAFWKAKTAKALRTWASVVIANQMRDTLRRMKHGRTIATDILPLLEQRRAYFQARYCKLFEEFLDQLAVWDASPDKSLQFQARVLRHHYVDGMTWKDVAEQLSIKRGDVDRIRLNAEAVFGGQSK
ncbi:MAG: hypothetical protein O3A00_24755 [Planctomycetota bacterium]|nr:hypothetical protein [Planctomycetota bacterium]